MLEKKESASLGSMKALWQHMRTLPYTLGPLRTFEEQFGALIKALEIFEPSHQDVALSQDILNRPDNAEESPQAEAMRPESKCRA
jgi:hypothetical protein